MEKIGKYQILEKIGEGGMGVVYKALDPLLDRVVALKTISSHLDSEPEMRTKFFREGRSAAQLSHKNIITIYDLGEDGGMAYLAMEFLEGEDLRTKIQKREIRSLEEKLGIMYEICAGLNHAHARRVIHRDVKPANVFITTYGQVKILDFGLARMISAETTRSESAPGSPNYMSPEQVRGESLDHRTDIFSVGALFYELLTFQKPFDGESVASTIFSILYKEPQSLLQVDPTLPPQLAGVIHKTLAKDVDARCQTLSEVMCDLRDCSPLLRSLQLPQSEGDEVATISLAEAGGFGELPQLSGRRRDSAVLEASESAPETESSLPAAIPPQRGRRFRMAHLVVASVLLALAATGIWWARRDARVFRADTVNASAPPESSPATVSGTGSRASHSDQLPAESGGQNAAGGPARGMTADPSRQAGVPSPGEVPAQGRPPESKSFPARQNEVTSKAKEVGRGAPSDPGTGLVAARIVSYEKRRAEDALEQMMSSRGRAEAADSGLYAAKSFETARSKEAAARASYDALRFTDAAEGFADAAGLYVAAALEAGSEKAARENQARMSEREGLRTAQRRMADGNRSAYEQERLDAVKAGADTKAARKYQEALQLASEAGTKWEREDFAGANADFEKATAAMRDAKSAAQDFLRKPAPPAADPTSKPAVVSAPPDNSRELISAVLRQYVASLQARDIQMLRSIWPGLGGQQEKALLEEFRNAREIQVRLAGIDIKVSGNSATVTARRSYNLLTVDGHRLQTETRTVVEIQKIGKDWLIERIQFEPI